MRTSNRPFQSPGAETHSKSVSIADSSNINNNCITLPKVKCAFHPHQAITNFCTCECCLLPLCPSCIKIHTIEHVNMKKISPQYQPITDLLQQIYEQVQELLTTTNESYKKVLDIDSRVDAFRSTIQQKVSSVKQSILSEVEKYFAKLDEDIQLKIQGMNYIQMLRQYKQQSRKTIIGLKNIQKSFNPQNDKIMRIVIKYKGELIKKQIMDFDQSLQQFLSQANNNFVTFSVREDFKHIIYGYLESMKKIQVSDVRTLSAVPNISSKLTQVYQKSSNQNKRQIRKSIGNFLAASSAKQRNNQENLCSGSSQYANNPFSSQQINFTPSKQQNRRSLSKGRGLSLMQINSTLNTTMGQAKGPKAVNICSPIQFNRTAIIRREK